MKTVLFVLSILSVSTLGLVLSSCAAPRDPETTPTSLMLEPGQTRSTVFGIDGYGISVHNAGLSPVQLRTDEPGLDVEDLRIEPGESWGMDSQGPVELTIQNVGDTATTVSIHLLDGNVVLGAPEAR